MGARTVYALILINKAGGLIYQRDFADGLLKLSINDYLVLAGTFHRYIHSLFLPATTSTSLSDNISTKSVFMP